MVDVVSDQVECSYAESVTGWAGDTFVLESEIKVQGGNSVATIQTANGVNDAYFNKATGSWDMSNSHLRLYMSSNIMPNTNTMANNGIQMMAFDGTNTAYWTVGGSDTYSGGWRDFFIDVESTPTSGSVNTAAVTRVGIRINTNTKPRNATNGWYDNFRYGNGLEVNSDAAEAIDFTDVSVEDALVANKYDILELIDGVIFGKGKITLGNAAGAKNCNLVSVSETLYFIDRVVATDLYGIYGTEGTGATNIDIKGLNCKTVGSSGAEVDFSATITSFALEASVLSGMGLIKFSQGTVKTTTFGSCGASTLSGTVTVTGSTWSLSDAITLTGTASLTSCFILNSTATSAVIASSLAVIDKCTFESDGTGHAVDLGTIAATTAMDWDNVTTGYAGTDGSTGNETILVSVDSGQTLTINVAATGTLPTIKNDGLGTVTVVTGQITVAVTVLDDTTGLPIPDARVQLYDTADYTTVIMNDDCNASGVASISMSYTADIVVEGWVREMNISGVDYTPKDIAGTITSSGFALTVRLVPLD